MYNKHSYNKEPLKIFEGLKYVKIMTLIFTALVISNVSYSQNYLSVKNASIKVSGNACIKAQSVILEEKGQINLASSETNLIISGDLSNNSGSTVKLNNGNVILKGNSKQKVKGTNKIVFKNLEINKNESSNEVILNQDIDVTGSLVMTKGTFDILNNNINLFSTGVILNESNENRIKATNGKTEGVGNGKIIATRVLNNGNNLNVAGLGIDIYSNNYTGLKTIERSHKEIWTSTSDVPSICRSFSFADFGKVTEDNNFSIHYFPSELNGLNESDLAIYKITNSENATVISTKLDNLNKKAITTSNEESMEVNYGGMETYTLFPKITSIDATINNPTIQNSLTQESSTDFKAFYSSNSKSIAVNFKSDVIENYSLEVYNASSKKVTTINFPVNIGDNKIMIDASSFSKSMYIVTMINKTNRFSSKVIINN
jgi:hypothetical protein